MCERGKVIYYTAVQSGGICKLIVFSCFFSSADAMDFVDEYTSCVSRRSCNEGAPPNITYPWDH